MKTWVDQPPLNLKLAAGGELFFGAMNSVATSVVILPGIVALLLFLVFTYLYEQSRQPYFRAWQIGWGAYCLHYTLDAWTFYRGPSAGAFFAGSMLLVAMGLCIFVSTRLIRERFRFRWYDLALAAAGAGVAVWNLRMHMVSGTFVQDVARGRHFTLEVLLATVLLYCSFEFYRYAQRKNSLAFQLLAISLALWAVLMGLNLFDNPFLTSGGHLLGPIPQMLLGIAMVMVLFENERTAVQENALAFSTLGVPPSRVLDAKELVPSMSGILDRLVAPLPTRRAIIYISEQWRTVLPAVQRGFSEELLNELESKGAGEFLSELAYRRGGFITFHHVDELAEPLPALQSVRFAEFKKLLAEQHIRNLTAVSLQTRERNFGVILFPHAQRKMFGSSNLRLLIGLALQIGLTLENYVIMHDAQRRTKEYELLTEIGQAISSRLDQDEVLRTIRTELGQIFDTTNFYVAFQEGDEIRFELEVEKGQVRPKRSRKVCNGLTEYIIRTGQPLLIQSDLEKTRERLGVTYIPNNPAK